MNGKYRSVITFDDYWFPQKLYILKIDLDSKIAVKKTLIFLDDQRSICSLVFMMKNPMK